MNPMPKAPRRPKAPRKPLRRTPMAPGRPPARGGALKRSRMRPGKRGTKHSRRPRELGFMHFCHDRGCELCLDRDMQELIGIFCPCSGPIEFAHLSDKKRYDVGDIGACLHQWVHRGIDGNAPWYVELERSGQHMFRMRLANRARRDWDALTPVQRADWAALAAARASAA
jgi:hypothetical protein